MILILLSGCNSLELIGPYGFDINTHSDSICFAVIGDYGKSGEDELAVANMVKSWNPDFIITTGDNNCCTAIKANTKSEF